MESVLQSASTSASCIIYVECGLASQNEDFVVEVKVGGAMCYVRLRGQRISKTYANPSPTARRAFSDKLPIFLRIRNVSKTRTWSQRATLCSKAVQPTSGINSTEGSKMRYELALCTLVVSGTPAAVGLPMFTAFCETITYGRSPDCSLPDVIMVAAFSDVAIDGGS